MRWSLTKQGRVSIGSAAIWRHSKITGLAVAVLNLQGVFFFFFSGVQGTLSPPNVACLSALFVLYPNSNSPFPRELHLQLRLICPLPVFPLSLNPCINTARSSQIEEVCNCTKTLMLIWPGEWVCVTDSADTRHVASLWGMEVITLQHGVVHTKAGTVSTLSETWDMRARWEIKFLMQTLYLQGCPRKKTPRLAGGQLQVIIDNESLSALAKAKCWRFGVHWMKSDMKHEKIQQRRNPAKSGEKRRLKDLTSCRSCLIMLCKQLCKHAFRENKVSE